MKNLLTIFALLGTVFLTSCKKDKANQYSYWVVNNDSFSTNETIASIGKPKTVLSSQGQVNSFNITFSIGYSLPTSGTFYVQKRSTAQDPDSASLSFYYKQQFYISSLRNQSLLYASEKNGKASYILTPGWFVNYYNESDSVLIHGAFNEP